MCSVSASLVADRNQNITTMLYSLDLFLQYPELRRIHLIVGRIDRIKRSLDAFKLRVRIIISGRIKLIKHVICIISLKIAVNLIVEHLVRFFFSRSALLHLQRAAAHKDQRIYGGG